ncbi:isoleucine--tRNA ligase [soil metagenome]
MRDYRETVFLPTTPFPMRAGLPKLEPELLAKWEAADLYHAVRKARQDAGAPLFVLHDGPPYANGDIHIGHALNKLLKDFVVRSQFAMGKDVDYVPGWDCHGLPIEWKIEEEVRKAGKTKDEVDPAEFRARCRTYAGHWIDAQMGEFKRLGVLGDWGRRYATMDYSSEATIVAEFHKVLMSGRLYRGSKPVMWSPVERTALADAEVEYHQQNSPMIWVKFPVRGYVRDGATMRPDLLTASVVIWTTTPWTIPANRAISYGPEIAYGLYRVDELKADQTGAAVGETLVVADKLAEEVFEAAGLRASRLEDVNPAHLFCAHPLDALAPNPDPNLGYGFPVPLLAGDHVTDDAGTGFVHTAPGHGVEDYQVWLASGRREIPDTVDENGAYYAHVPLFAGLQVIEAEGKKAGKFGPANGEVTAALERAGTLLAKSRFEHSYPHSWRSKAPVLYRNTPQWFVSMDAEVGASTLRKTALDAIDCADFFPETGRNRIRGMVENRPDLLISRQRAWGTPLAMFVDKATGEPLCDAAVNRRIQDVVREGGSDAWFSTDAGVFLGPDRNPDDYERVNDILDVWFDSGATHAFTLEGRNDTRSPADLYLEGSDQARGWFQSSLLESCATRGRAPYKAVLTHGFTLDEAGEKMSKSKGNTTDPLKVIADSGAEIIRLWVAMVDYAEDQRIGKTILQTVSDSYRKLRNTLRYLLGALEGFDEAERLPLDEMPPLERWILHRLWVLDGEVRTAYEGYRFSEVWRLLTEFAQGDLSALYFDIRKDALYCDRPDSDRRRACRTVMDAIFERLTIWLAPLAAFTCEEAWATRFPDAGPNALRVFPKTPESWAHPEEDARWRRIERVLDVVTGALEIERREKRLGGALEASPVVWIADADLLSAFGGIDAAEVFRTSSAEVRSGEGPTEAFRRPGSPVAVQPRRAEGDKCRRSWKVLPEVTEATGWLTLRDLDAVQAWDAAHKDAA